MTQFYFGLDFGTKKMGVAVGQLLTCQAKPLATLPIHNELPNWKEFDALVDTWQPQAFIVGLPLNEDGSASKLSKKAELFAEKLRARYPVPVHLMNEHLSSFAARQALTEDPFAKNRKKKGLDALAAVVILESWLSETKRLP